MPAVSAIALSLGVWTGMTGMAGATGMDDSAGVAAARAHRAAHGAEILREFSTFLALPNLSTDADRIRRNAAWIVAAFARRGITLEARSVDGAPPVVIGRWECGAARTIGIYAHYDGQPVRQERWSSPPWVPTLRTARVEAGGTVREWPTADETIDSEWRIYARSAADDKAPIAAVLAAIDALAAAEVPATSNVVFLFEGEEEIGSPHLGAAMAQYRERLSADIWLIGDGPVHTSGAPQLVFGVRGVTGFEITVYGPATHLHSGHYGNWAPNPALRLAELLASMKDDDGRVTIDGFYDDIEPLSATERAAVERLPVQDIVLQHEFGIARPEMTGVRLAESILLPSLNVRGMASGGVGAEARNMVPATATASVDIRLVKGNDPARMLDRVEAHLRERGYLVLDRDPTDHERITQALIARFARESGYAAARTPMDLPIVAPIVAAAVAAAGADDALLVPTLGGSLPLYRFGSDLGAPAIIVPLANHDNNQHGPDENLRIANLWYGVDVWAGILSMPARAPGSVEGSG